MAVVTSRKGGDMMKKIKLLVILLALVILFIDD
jgi:hypothetical protein